MTYRVLLLILVSLAIGGILSAAWTWLPSWAFPWVVGYMMASLAFNLREVRND